MVWVFIWLADISKGLGFRLWGLVSFIPKPKTPPPPSLFTYFSGGGGRRVRESGLRPSGPLRRASRALPVLRGLRLGVGDREKKWGRARVEGHKCLGETWDHAEFRNLSDVDVGGRPNLHSHARTDDPSVLAALMPSSRLRAIVS